MGKAKKDLPAQVQASAAKKDKKGKKGKGRSNLNLQVIVERKWIKDLKRNGFIGRRLVEKGVERAALAKSRGKNKDYDEIMDDMVKAGIIAGDDDEG